MYYLLKVYYVQRRTDEDGIYYTIVDDAGLAELDDQGVDYKEIDRGQDRESLEDSLQSYEMYDAYYGRY